MRLIDADALVKKYFSEDARIALSYANKIWMRRLINESPTIDAEPVVRCKDCECWECEQDTKGEIYKSHLCDVFECGTTAYDFCSYGERKGKVSE